ncbi:hypothetical protein BGZ83_008393 [Gryganskiella cystojenkinii]|nr:hypothetical protein BGZ83_008393 [Gryganskiella cystojenkinii]
MSPSENSVLIAVDTTPGSPPTRESTVDGVTTASISTFTTSTTTTESQALLVLTAPLSPADIEKMTQESPSILMNMSTSAPSLMPTIISLSVGAPYPLASPGVSFASASTLDHQAHAESSLLSHSAGHGVDYHRQHHYTARNTATAGFHPQTPAAVLYAHQHGFPQIQPNVQPMQQSFSTSPQPFTAHHQQVPQGQGPGPVALSQQKFQEQQAAYRFLLEHRRQQQQHQLELAQKQHQSQNIVVNQLTISEGYALSQSNTIMNGTSTSPVHAHSHPSSGPVQLSPRQQQQQSMSPNLSLQHQRQIVFAAQQNHQVEMLKQNQHQNQQLQQTSSMPMPMPMPMPMSFSPSPDPCFPSPHPLNMTLPPVSSVYSDPNMGMTQRQQSVMMPALPSSFIQNQPHPHQPAPIYQMNQFAQRTFSSCPTMVNMGPICTSQAPNGMTFPLQQQQRSFSQQHEPYPLRAPIQYTSMSPPVSAAASPQHFSLHQQYFDSGTGTPYHGNPYQDHQQYQNQLEQQQQGCFGPLSARAGSSVLGTPIGMMTNSNSLSPSQMMEQGGKEIQVSTETTTPLSVQFIQTSMRPEDLADRLNQVRSEKGLSPFSPATESPSVVDKIDDEDVDMSDAEVVNESQKGKPPGKEQDDGNRSDHSAENKNRNDDDDKGEDRQKINEMEIADSDEENDDEVLTQVTVTYSGIQDTTAMERSDSTSSTTSQMTSSSSQELSAKNLVERLSREVLGSMMTSPSRARSKTTAVNSPASTSSSSPVTQGGGSIDGYFKTRQRKRSTGQADNVDDESLTRPTVRQSRRPIKEQDTESDDASETSDEGEVSDYGEQQRAGSRRRIQQKPKAPAPHTRSLASRRSSIATTASINKNGHINNQGGQQLVNKGRGNAVVAVPTKVQPTNKRKALAMAKAKTTGASSSSNTADIPATPILPDLPDLPSAPVPSVTLTGANGKGSVVPHLFQEYASQLQEHALKIHTAAATLYHQASGTPAPWSSYNGGIGTTTSGPIRCTFEGCLRTFASQGLLKSHVVSHDSNRPYWCDECSLDGHTPRQPLPPLIPGMPPVIFEVKRYKRNHDLLRHKREQHPPREVMISRARERIDSKEKRKMKKEKETAQGEEKKLEYATLTAQVKIEGEERRREEAMLAARAKSQVFTEAQIKKMETQRERFLGKSGSASSIGARKVVTKSLSKTTKATQPKVSNGKMKKSLQPKQARSEDEGDDEEEYEDDAMPLRRRRKTA